MGAFSAGNFIYAAALGRIKSRFHTSGFFHTPNEQPCTSRPASRDAVIKALNSKKDCPLSEIKK
jgi:hypothetical protein